MRKKLMAVLCICTVLLTGCGGSETVRLPFISSAQTASIYYGNDTGGVSTFPLYSAELCVFDEDSPMLLKADEISGLTAGSALLVDESKNELYYQNNVFKRLYPASLTKLMTAYMVYKYGNLDADVTFSYDATHLKFTSAKLCKFAEGDTMRMGDLLAAFVVYAGNDAGVALAEAVSGSEEAFVKKMNEEAKTLGAVDTHFSNSHGLHQKDHYSTLYDLYLIFHEVLKNEDFVALLASKSCEVPYKDKNGEASSKSFSSAIPFHTEAVKAPAFFNVVGGMAGNTNEAGACVILSVKDINGKEYIISVMKASGTDALYKEVNKLLESIPLT